MTIPNLCQSNVNDKIQEHELKIITKPLKYTIIQQKYLKQNTVLYLPKQTTKYGPQIEFITKKPFV